MPNKFRPLQGDYIHPSMGDIKQCIYENKKRGEDVVNLVGLVNQSNYELEAIYKLTY